MNANVRISFALRCIISLLLASPVATPAKSISVSASFGALTHYTESSQRFLDVDIRVGSASFDNSHRLQTTGDNFYRPATLLPLNNDTTAMKAMIWYHTDKMYKEAVEELMRCKTEKETRVVADGSAPDFSSSRAEVFLDSILAFRPDTSAYIQKTTKTSSRFLADQRILSGQADFSYTLTTVWFVNNEGSRIRAGAPRYTISLTAYTRADDGMYMPLYEFFTAKTLGHLPTDSALVVLADTMVSRLSALRGAPVIEPYSGPAILSGKGTAVFFHEILGYRLEAQRMKSDHDGQTFKKKVGEKVLPENLSIRADPTLETFGRYDLNGSYRYDDEGVKALPVKLIDRGVLVGFLTSRAPIQGFPSSNGHGRKAPGMIPTSRQSNLIVEST